MRSDITTLVVARGARPASVRWGRWIVSQGGSFADQPPRTARAWLARCASITVVTAPPHLHASCISRETSLSLPGALMLHDDFPEMRGGTPLADPVEVVMPFQVDDTDA